MKKRRTKPMIARFVLEQLLLDESLSVSVKEKDLKYLSSLSPHQIMSLGFTYIESLDLYRVISIEKSHRGHINSLEK